MEQQKIDFDYLFVKFLNGQYTFQKFKSENIAMMNDTYAKTQLKEKEEAKCIILAQSEQKQFLFDYAGDEEGVVQCVGYAITQKLIKPQINHPYLVTVHGGDSYYFSTDTKEQAEFRFNKNKQKNLATCMFEGNNIVNHFACNDKYKFFVIGAGFVNQDRTRYILDEFLFKQATKNNNQNQSAQKKEIVIGILGFGQRMNALMRMILSNINKDPCKKIRVKKVYDIDERSQLNASFFFENIIICKNQQEVTQDPEIQWVLIASWNSAHKQQVIEALQAGKHVFCEKPPATKIEDAIEMRDAWYKTGKKQQLVLGFVLRFSPFYQTIHKLINQDKAIGDIISMEFNETLHLDHGGYIMGDWRRLVEHSGGHLLEKCCHDFDLVNWILKTKAKKVSSFGGLNFFIPKYEYRMKELGQGSYQQWPGLIMENPFTGKKDIVDNQVCIIEFENNVRATFHTNCQTGIQERRMYINGTHGSIRADVLTGEIQLKKVGYFEPLQNIESEGKGGHGSGDYILCQEVVDAMFNGTVPNSGIEDGLLSLITCLACDIAREKDQVFHLNELWAKAGLK